MLQNGQTLCMKGLRIKSYRVQPEAVTEGVL